MTCKICNGNSEFLFKKKLLNKYDVKYYRCADCLFIQTEEPYWLDEAYGKTPISPLDVGIVRRNLLLSGNTIDIIKKIFKNSLQVNAIDYGGAHGLFVRLMRDEGYQFYRQDKYCENLFSLYFDIKDAPVQKFELLTAFELFEHLPNPKDEIKNMFAYSDIILFSTVLQPKNLDENWWYLVPEGGQHVALYNIQTLESLAKQFDAHLLSNGFDLHILSKNKLDINLNDLNGSLISKILRKLKINFRSSSSNFEHINKDYEFIKTKMYGN